MAKIDSYNGEAYGKLEIMDDTQGKTTVPAELLVGGSSVINQVAAAQADSTAIDVAGLVTDFNALLAKLRAAGLMAT